MAKTVTEARLTTRAARAQLAEGIHYRSIDPDVHLSYRKGRRGGVWGVRLYLGEGQYRRERLGTADDIIDEGNLTFDAAVKEARKLVTAWRREQSAKAAGPILTVSSAVKAYIKARDARDSARAGREVKSDAWRLHRHVLSDEELASTEIFRLTKSALVKWRSSLGGAPSSRTRTANDFRAALKAVAPDAALREVIIEGLKKPKGEASGRVARDNQILSDDEMQRIVTAAREIDAEDGWDGDLHIMVALLAATGARFGQLARCCVDDVQGSRLMVPSSRKGTGEDVDNKPPIAVAIGEDIRRALIPHVKGRRAMEPLLQRWRYRQTGPCKWERDRRGPWTSASELSRPFAAIAKRAGLPGVIPYALRHSSIVRGLRANLPARLVAARHDTSLQMVEKTYAKWIVDGLDELLAAAVVPIIVGDGGSNVVPMEARRG